MTFKVKQVNRIRRHARVRAKISGTSARPRVAVFKSNQHIFVQAIDDTTRKTIAGISDQKTKSAKNDAPKELGGKEKRAFAIGEQVGELLKKSGVEAVVFDKGGFKYHGRVKAVAEGLRKAGIRL